MAASTSLWAVEGSPAALRPALESDAEAVAAIYRRYVLETSVSFEEAPPDAMAIRERMVGTPRLPWYVAVRNDEVVGYAYGSAHRARAAYRWAVDVSVYLTDDERGRGTGRALYERLLPELARLGYVSAFAGIALPNPPSVVLHERLGFIRLGVFRQVGYKRGQWHDVGWWQRSLTEPPLYPVTPQPWTPH